MDFKDRLRTLREARGVSAAQLAGTFDKSEGAIRMWETGRSKPDVDTLIKLAEYFDCSTDFLLGLSDNKNHQSFEYTENRFSNLIELMLAEKNPAIIAERIALILENAHALYDEYLCSTLYAIVDVLKSILEVTVKYGSLKNKNVNHFIGLSHYLDKNASDLSYLASELSNQLTVIAKDKSIEDTKSKDIELIKALTENFVSKNKPLTAHAPLDWMVDSDSKHD